MLNWSLFSLIFAQIDTLHCLLHLITLALSLLLINHHSHFPLLFHPILNLRLHQQLHKLELIRLPLHDQHQSPLHHAAVNTTILHLFIDPLHLLICLDPIDLSDCSLDSRLDLLLVLAQAELLVALTLHRVLEQHDLVVFSLEF